MATVERITSSIPESNGTQIRQNSSSGVKNSGQNIGPNLTHISNSLIGAPIERLEDPRFLKGQGTFVGDLVLDVTLVDGVGAAPARSEYPTQLVGG